MHTVLVVEDDRALRTLMVRTLSEKGYRAVEASDGIEALEKLAADRPRDADCGDRPPRV